MTKEELKLEGLNIIERFCELNNIQMPEIHFVNQSRHNDCGWYSNKTIFIVPNACATPATNPGFKWSYPHYLIDRTILGVICHEFGHYVHEHLGFPKIDHLGCKITGYEPNMYERFAETMRIFLTNPDLLRQYNPQRYEFLIKKCGLRPVYRTHWRVQLNYYGEVNPKYIVACENKIRNANKNKML